jgi:hypothetical protein
MVAYVLWATALEPVVYRAMVSLSLILATVSFLPHYGVPQDIDYNYPDRRAVVVNISPDLKLSSFTFQNNYETRSGDQFLENFSWENTSTKDIVSFEIVILKYDPFNRQLLGSRHIFPGKQEFKYEALKPKESFKNGLISRGREDSFTEVLFVSAIRFGDNTVWTFNPADVLASIKSQLPDIAEPGKITPEKGK